MKRSISSENVSNKKARFDIQELIIQAMEALEDHEYKKCLEICKKILDIESEHPDALVFAGLSWVSLGRHESAKPYLHDAIQRNTSHLVVAHNTLGDIYESEYLYETAIDHFEQSVKYDPRLSLEYALYSGNFLIQLLGHVGNTERKSR